MQHVADFNPVNWAVEGGREAVLPGADWAWSPPEPAAGGAAAGVQRVRHPGVPRLPALGLAIYPLSSSRTRASALSSSAQKATGSPSPGHLPPAHGPAGHGLLELARPSAGDERLDALGAELDDHVLVVLHGEELLAEPGARVAEHLAPRHVGIGRERLEQALEGVAQRPPAIAGRITRVSPSPTGVSRPSRTRTSSSLR